MTFPYSFRRITAVFVLAFMLTACNPFKVTDPADPRFDIKKFKFEDYGDNETIAMVLKQIFPQGSSRVEVEELFVNILEMETSSPWHISNTEDRASVIPLKGSDNYGIYYLKRKNKKTGQYITAIYTLENKLLNLGYGQMSLVKGQGSQILFLIEQNKEIKNDD